MNESLQAAHFEIMRFGAGGNPGPQLEQERGRWRAGGGRPGIGAAAARPLPRLRRRRPAPWPAYPQPAWPWARWDAPPQDEPLDDGDQGEVTDAERAVLERFPPQLRAVLLAMPDGRRPRYVSLGMLPQAARNRDAATAGLYVIVFSSAGRRRAYHGQSGVDVRARLEKHLLGAVLLGLLPFVSGHEVFFALAPAGTDPRAIELAINRAMLKPHPGVLTNQRHELEAEMLGEAWL